MLRILPLKYSRGRQGDWNVDSQTGDNACSALKSLLKELDYATSGEIAQARRAVFTPVLDGLREFALNYARQRRAEGRAEFHDLLAWAHELLRDDIEVRDHFRRRFSHLLHAIPHHSRFNGLSSAGIRLPSSACSTRI